MYVFVVAIVVFYPTIQEPYLVFMELGGKFEGKKGQDEGQERQNKEKRGRMKDRRGRIRKKGAG